MGEWISVEERLPEPRTEEHNLSLAVLVAKSNSDILIGVLHRKGDGRIQWVDCDNYIIGGVTHWMPLPEPPK